MSDGSGQNTGDALEPRVGRPPVVLDDVERQRLTGMAALGLNQELAASRLGFSGRTLRRVFDRDEEAALSWTLGRAEAADKALKLLWKQAEEGSPAAAIFLGKTLAGLREKGGEWEDGDRPPVAVQIVMPGAQSPAEYAKRVNGSGEVVEVER